MDTVRNITIDRREEEMEGQDHGGQGEDVSQHLLDQDQIAESLQYFASCDTGILKTEETLLHLSTIELVSDNGGLSPPQLELLIQQVTSVPCPATLARRLLYSLVPSHTVSAQMLLQLSLWGLGDSSLSRDYVVLPTIKLVTLCLQYDCVTDKQELESIYELYLSHLARDKLTNSVAELLQLLTNKKDVTEWRVRSVLRCQSKLGSSHPLDSLVWRFRQFRPDLVPNCLAPAARASSARTVIGKRFHKVWEDRVDRTLDTMEGVWIGGNQVGNIFKKRQRETLVPGREVLSVSSGGVVENIHQVQLPANILALLGCRANVHVLAMDKGLVERFSVTLFHTLRNEFVCCEEKVGTREEARRTRRREKLLGHLVKLQETLQQGLPVVGRFLSEYLDTWDGTSHFLAVLRLVSQLQMTDYKELHDCVVAPLTRHFTSYNMVKQLVMLGFLHTLLRTWGAIEYERFTKHTRSIFPVNTVHCENALEATSHLSKEIGELAVLALSLARERGESTNLLTSQVLTMYRVSQLVMLEYSVPLRLELPTVYLYSALFSHSASQLAQACQHILLNKNRVFPTLNKALRSLELVGGYDNLNSSLVANMVSKESREELLVATRDMLVFLSPGNVHLTMGSILRQGWSLPLGEEWLKEGLYLSSHPALLPYVMKYLDGLELSTTDKQLAWLQLSEEQEDQQEWESNIKLGQEGTTFNSRQFYSNSQPESRLPMAPSTPRKGNILAFLSFLSADLPAIEEFVLEYKKKAAGAVSSSRGRKNTDSRSVCSQGTQDSGVESLHPRRRKVQGSQEREEDQGGRGTEPGSVARQDSLAHTDRQSRHSSTAQGGQETSSSLQQNLSRLSSSQSRDKTGRQESSSSRENTSNTRDRASNQGRQVELGEEDLENRKTRGNKKRKSVGSPLPVSKRRTRSGDLRREKVVLRERNK
eukprot:GFUD01016120.1.p1 GENE.GFUD01016120.1~~GFUD01016120.1.p1  ORF type:complete len:933 (+),score=344.21 GFUD01016120.1:134-2932(+)